MSPHSSRGAADLFVVLSYTCLCENAGQSWWACLDLCWDVAVSRSASNSAAVVDGLDLNLTPLARALVPPPMCHTKVRPPPLTS
jgi:hypothetical protein